MLRVLRPWHRFPTELVDASSLEVSFGQVFVCPSYWILTLGRFSCAFSQFCPNLVFQIAHKAASSSWWEDKEPALFLAIPLRREAVKLGYLRAENRWFTAEQLHRNQWEATLENVAYYSEKCFTTSLSCLWQFPLDTLMSDHSNRASKSLPLTLGKVLIQPSTQTHRTSFGIQPKTHLHILSFLNGNATAF